MSFDRQQTGLTLTKEIRAALAAPQSVQEQAHVAALSAALRQDGCLYHDLPNPRARAFLAAYSLLGNLTAASVCANVDRVMHYRWMGSVGGSEVLDGYPEAFQDAEERSADVIEGEAHRRAVSGWLRPVFYRGSIAGYELAYSDRLMEMMLAGAKPSKYQRRIAQTVSGPDGGPVRVSAAVAVRTLSDEDLLAIATSAGASVGPVLPGGLLLPSGPLGDTGEAVEGQSGGHGQEDASGATTEGLVGDANPDAKPWE